MTALAAPDAEKATYADHASRLVLPLGQFFREAGAAFAAGGSDQQAETDALEAALDAALFEVCAALHGKFADTADLMKEQQRRIDDLNGRVIRLETMLDSGGSTSE